MKEVIYNLFSKACTYITTTALFILLYIIFTGDTGLLDIFGMDSDMMQSAKKLSEDQLLKLLNEVQK